MIYSGPELLKPCCAEVYDKVRPSLPRAGDAHLVAGGIGKLYIEDKRTIIKGDDKTNDSIDEKFRVFQASGNPKALEDALAICREATIITPPQASAYSPNFDVILLDPEMIIYHILYKTLPFGQLRKLPPGLAFEIVQSDRFPFYATHELVHWDQGDTKILTAIRASFHETGYSFDKKVDGHFPVVEEHLESKEYKKMSESNEPSQEAEREISSLIHQLIELGIHDTAETISEMVAGTIGGLETRLKPETHPGLNLILAHFIATLGVKESLQMFKEKFDQAFVEQKSVYEFI